MSCLRVAFVVQILIMIGGACRKEDDSFSPRLKPLSFFAWCAADPVSSGADLPQSFSQKTLECRPAQARERPRLTRTSWESRWLGTIVVILGSSLRCHFLVEAVAIRCHLGSSRYRMPFRLLKAVLTVHEFYSVPLQSRRPGVLN